VILIFLERRILSESKLLVAVSSPWASEKLAKPIVDLASRLGAEVIVVHVAQQQDEDEKESDVAQRGQQTLSTLTDALKIAGITAEGLMLYADDTAKAILNTAHAQHCTLILLGLTRKSVLKRLFGGDIPANLMKQADLPVLLCPASWSGTM